MQVSLMNVAMMILMILCRQWVAPLFVDVPTPEIVEYAGQYLLMVAPFYLLLGVLCVYRSTIQSMDNALVPFFACIIELVMRVGATTLLSAAIGYAGICLATPLAWIGANLILVPVYWHMIRRPILGEQKAQHV